MRRLIVIAVISLVACSAEEVAAPDLPNGTYAGAGRDALCIAGSPGAKRGGFVVYGADDANCSARGIIAGRDATWTLTPDGDADCRISLLARDGRIVLVPGTATCEYYCGPNVSFDTKSFAKQGADNDDATDFGGDPLC